jgi:TolA-binding protein
MKNKSRYFVLALIILSLSACESKVYKAERQLWRAHKLAKAIYQNPKGTPPFQFARAQDAYRAIIKKYPDTIFAIQCQFSIGHLYLVRGEFENARAEYKKLTVDCGKKGSRCPDAEFAIGNSFELEDKWNSALVHYRKIMKSYPLSSKSIDLPIYIVGHYARAKDEANVKLFVDEAMAYYTDLKSKSQAEQGDYILQGLIARIYMEAGYWLDAIDSLNKLIRDYPKQNVVDAYFLKALVYNNKLKDKDKAKIELQNIVTLYPKSKLAKQAEGFLKKL